jgi:hypothetical protein
MSDSLKVLATFDVETGGFDAKREEIVQGLTEMEQAAKGAQAGADKLSGATGVLTSKVGTLAKVEGDAAAAAGNLAKEQDAAAKSTTQLGTSVGGLQGILGRVGRGFREFGAGARDGLKTAVKEVGGFRGILSQTGSNIASFGKGAINTFKGVGNFAGNALRTVGQGVVSATQGIPVVGQLAAALGPVGIAAAGAAVGLFKLFTNTDAGATAVQGLGKTAGAVFDRVTGLAKSLFDTVTSGTGIIGKGFDLLTDAVSFFLNKLTPIGDIFRALSETSLFKALKDDFEFGQQIANQLDELDDKQREVNLTVAQNEIGIRKNLAALRDTTKSTEERLAIADEITKIEQENLNQKRELLRTELAIARSEANRQQQLKGEVDDSLKQQITDLNVAIANAEADSVSLTERVATRRAGIVEQEEQRKAAIRQKAIAAREKAEAVAAQKAEQRLQAEAKLNETLEGLAAESRNRQLTEAEREVEAVRKKYADLEKVTLEGIQKLREAAPANEQSAIAAKEAEALLAIDKAKAEELAALRAEASQAAQEQLRVALQTEEEIRREAVLKDFDERVALAEQFVEDEAERNAVILELTRIAEEELTAITQEGVDARIAATEAETEALKRAEEAKAQIRATEVQSAIGTTQALGDFVQAAAGQNEEAAKVALGIQKAVAIANIIVQTQAATAAALAQSVLALGPIAGPPAAAPTIALLQTTAGLSIGAILAQAITGAYTGEERVGSNGERPVLPGTRDRYLRKVHKDEGILDAETNLENLPALNAMRRGTFDEWVDRNYILPAIEGLNINDDAKVVKWSQGDMGERMARSIALPRMFDRGIVGAVNNSRKEQAQTNALLEALVHNTRPRRSNPRYN